MPQIRQGGDANAFRIAVEQEISLFKNVAIVRRLATGSIELSHYHLILTTIFHQTRSSPYTFAKAAFFCPWRLEVIKEYLLQHAEEEKSHWRWVLDDLRNTGFDGPCPTTTFPHASCEAYIALNARIAEQMPPARLAIAAVLEGIGARFGGLYGAKLLSALNIQPNQASFFLSHGETDKHHVEELLGIIALSPLTTEEWGWMEHAARVAGQCYRRMYDHEGFE